MAIKVVIFCKSPLVMIGAVEHKVYTGPAADLSLALRGRPYWMLLKLHWSMEGQKSLAGLAVAYRQHAAEFPEHRLFYMCNTERELLGLQQAGVPSLLCNHNIFVSDKIFDVQPAERKEFDAIYNARPVPYKRHELCANVPRLALIYYATGAEERKRVKWLKSVLPDAAFVNDIEAGKCLQGLANPKARDFVRRTLEQHNHVALRPDRVATFCNRAKIGLCLSAIEGAMYASMEYLMCGLPVVSTVNRGGRDFYFDPEFCATVPADPVAVGEAVAMLIERRIAPQYVRAKTLAKVAHDRNRFLNFVQAIYAGQNVTRSASVDWNGAFVHTMTEMLPLDRILRPK
jgi:glycosyltransferase involved in cell wall biosynthesis